MRGGGIWRSLVGTRTHSFSRSPRPARKRLSSRHPRELCFYCSRAGAWVSAAFPRRGASSPQPRESSFTLHSGASSPNHWMRFLPRRVESPAKGIIFYPPQRPVSSPIARPISSPHTQGALFLIPPLVTLHIFYNNYLCITPFLCEKDFAT